ncbi:uncharacterized protein LOC129914378 [Episyrphus balteatus]|uniref:uncharacterized protein LOC129914378 n=1 Tax=Episyrphus balteatus TaxID=286459 RepID=UPI00248615A6|nr:uncharacterized protein LOC129914378 [Episyrphus balteatus]
MENIMDLGFFRNFGRRDWMNLGLCWRRRNDVETNIVRALLPPEASYDYKASYQREVLLQFLPQTFVFQNLGLVYLQAEGLIMGRRRAIRVFHPQRRVSFSTLHC